MTTTTECCLWSCRILRQKLSVTRKTQGHSARKWSILVQKKTLKYKFSVTTPFKRTGHSRPKNLQLKSTCFVRPPQLSTGMTWEWRSTASVLRFRGTTKETRKFKACPSSLQRRSSTFSTVRSIDRIRGSERLSMLKLLKASPSSSTMTKRSTSTHSIRSCIISSWSKPSVTMRSSSKSLMRRSRKPRKKQWLSTRRSIVRWLATLTQLTNSWTSSL